MKEEELINTFQSVFSTPEGRKVLKHLCTISHIDSCHFNENPIIMAKNEGERRIVLQILYLANVNIQSLIEEIYGQPTISN